MGRLVPRLLSIWSSRMSQGDRKQQIVASSPGSKSAAGTRRRAYPVLSRRASSSTQLPMSAALLFLLLYAANIFKALVLSEKEIEARPALAAVMSSRRAAKSVDTEQKYSFALKETIKKLVKST